MRIFFFLQNLNLFGAVYVTEVPIGNHDDFLIEAGSWFTDTAGITLVDFWLGSGHMVCASYHIQNLGDWHPNMQFLHVSWPETTMIRSPHLKGGFWDLLRAIIASDGRAAEKRNQQALEKTTGIEPGENDQTSVKKKVVKGLEMGKRKY